MSGPAARRVALRLALRSLAHAWDAYRQHDVAGANRIASAAALLLALPELQQLSDESLERAVRVELQDRAAVFLAIVSDFGLPRDERLRRTGKPSVPTTQPPSDESEKPF